MTLDLTPLCSAVREAGIDAWALYDFRGSNRIAWDILGLAADAHCTRRWMVVAPAQGPTTAIVHRLEQQPLSHVHADRVLLYDTHQSWNDALRTTLGGLATVAMEYSPMGALPAVARVDAGTIEAVRACGPDVVTSADLAQRFTAVLTTEQLAANGVTAGLLRDSVLSAFRLIRSRLLANESITEFDVQRHILQEFAARNLVSDASPIVAIGPNAASPHYAPTFLTNSPIERDQVVLIDAWARQDAPRSVYADITWVGYTGSTVPDDVAAPFDVLVRARDAAVDLVRTRMAAGLPVQGSEVDRACRAVVEAAGYGASFIHRTGHSITHEVHGPGANMDDFETHDTRTILRGTSFSVEPGIYMPGLLGLRTELDVVVDHDGIVHIPSGPVQTGILPLLADDAIPTT